MTLTEAWQASTTAPATDADLAALEAVVRDYYEGWYTGDAERMARAVHPALAKRAYGQGTDRAPVLDETTAEEMVAATASGAGHDRAGGTFDIRFAEVHLIRTPDGWQILNVLWRWADGHGPRA